MEGSSLDLIEILSFHLPGWTEENHENLGHYHQCPSQESNETPSGYQKCYHSSQLAMFFTCQVCLLHFYVPKAACHSSKKSCHLCKKDYETEEEGKAQQWAVEPLMNE
jgi:hypothetical protein